MMYPSVRGELQMTVVYTKDIESHLVYKTTQPSAMNSFLTSRKPVSRTDEADTESFTFMNWLTLPSSPTFGVPRGDEQCASSKYDISLCTKS